MVDFVPLETEACIATVLGLNRERLIAGHPGPGDRVGARVDVQDRLARQQDASSEVTRLVQDGACGGRAR
jgi:hypothetical protein